MVLPKKKQKKQITYKKNKKKNINPIDKSTKTKTIDEKKKK